MDKIIFWILGIGLLLGQVIQLPLAGFDAPLIDIAVVVSIVIGVGAWLVRRDYSLQQFRSLLPVAIFGVAVLISWLISLPVLSASEVLVSGLYLARLLGYLLVPFIVVANFSAERLIVYTRWLLWLFAGFALLGLLQLAIFPDFGVFEYLNWDPHNGRLLSSFLDPNFAGIWLALGLGLALAIWWSSRRERWLALAVGVLLVFANFLTLSRSALLALVAAVFAVTAIKNWRQLGITVLLLVVLILSTPVLQARIKGALEIDVTSGFRLESWQNGVHTWLTHPVFGVGYNTLTFRRYEQALPGSVKLVERAGAGYDSSLITVAATTGTVGLLAFLYLVVVSLRLAWRGVTTRSGIFSLWLFSATITLLLSSWFVNAWLYAPILLTWLMSLAFVIKENND
jgi:O-antigen ligase